MILPDKILPKFLGKEVDLYKTRFLVYESGELIGPFSIKLNINREDKT
jgi:hypothetical protein